MSFERKSAHQRAFSHHLRTGQRFTNAEWFLQEERKFNPYHDEIGRFSSAPGATVSYGRSNPLRAEKNPARSVSRTQNPERVEPAASKDGARPISTGDVGSPSSRARATAFLNKSRRAWRGADDVPNDNRWAEWAKRPARSSLCGKHPPEIVNRIRAVDWRMKTEGGGDRVVKFSEIEDNLMGKSRQFWIENIIPPYVREHAVFVYQSNENPKSFTARMVSGNGSTSMGQLKDFETGKPLALGDLPQVSGYRLVMVEHTHPVPAVAFGATGFSAPSNSAMYIAAKNPGVSFVVNQADLEKFPVTLAKSSFLYFGF